MSRLQILRMAPARGAELDDAFIPDADKIRVIVSLDDAEGGGRYHVLRHHESGDWLSVANVTLDSSGGRRAQSIDLPADDENDAFHVLAEDGASAASAFIRDLDGAGGGRYRGRQHLPELRRAFEGDALPRTHFPSADGYHLRSPNGTPYRITISDDGVLQAEPMAQETAPQDGMRPGTRPEWLRSPEWRPARGPTADVLGSDDRMRSDVALKPGDTRHTVVTANDPALRDLGAELAKGLPDAASAKTPVTEGGGSDD